MHAAVDALDGDPVRIGPVLVQIETAPQRRLPRRIAGPRRVLVHRVEGEVVIPQGRPLVLLPVPARALVGDEPVHQVGGRLHPLRPAELVPRAPQQGEVEREVVGARLDLVRGEARDVPEGHELVFVEPAARAQDRAPPARLLLRREPVLEQLVGLQPGTGEPLADEGAGEHDSVQHPVHAAVRVDAAIDVAAIAKDRLPQPSRAAPRVVRPRLRVEQRGREDALLIEEVPVLRRVLRPAGEAAIRPLAVEESLRRVEEHREAQVLQSGRRHGGLRCSRAHVWLRTMVVTSTWRPCPTTLPRMPPIASGTVWR